jgi:autotransporter-associated beta strand protein
VSGPLNLRGDGGYTGLAVDVADGSAATDLLVSGNITELYGPLGLTKSGDGTMELSGVGSYTGATTVIKTFKIKGTQIKRLHTLLMVS